MGQNSTKDLPGSRKRSIVFWDSFRSSNRASSYAIDQCTPFSTLTGRNENLNLGQRSEKPAIGRIDKVLNYCKRKISRKESFASSQTGTLSADSLESASAITSKQPDVKGLNELVACTKFSREELKLMYRGFKNECPSGVVEWDTFSKIYVELFPSGDTSSYARFIFNTFDTNRDGKITFENFAIGLSKSMHGSLDEKLKWTFQLYDLNNDGILTKMELMEVLDAVYQMSSFQISTTTDVLCASELEHSSRENQFGLIFEAIDEDGDGMVTEAEFVEACLKDTSLLRSLVIANHYDASNTERQPNATLPCTDAAKNSSHRRKYSEYTNTGFKERKIHHMGSLPDLRDHSSSNNKFEILYKEFLE